MVIAHTLHWTIIRLGKKLVALVRTENVVNFISEAPRKQIIQWYFNLILISDVRAEVAFKWQWRRGIACCVLCMCFRWRNAPIRWISGHQRMNIYGDKWWQRSLRPRKWRRCSKNLLIACFERRNIIIKRIYLKWWKMEKQTKYKWRTDSIVACNCDQLFMFILINDTWVN